MPRPDINGMVLLGWGLPSQLEEEDEATLLECQERWIEEQQNKQTRAWQNQVRKTFG